MIKTNDDFIVIYGTTKSDTAVPSLLY